MKLILSIYFLQYSLFMKIILFYIQILICWKSTIEVYLKHGINYMKPENIF